MDNDFIAGLLLVIIVVFIGYIDDFTKCNAKAKVLGYTCDYGIFTGCVLHKPDGTNILLEQIRDYR